MYFKLRPLLSMLDVQAPVVRLQTHAHWPIEPSNVRVSIVAPCSPRRAYADSGGDVSLAACLGSLSQLPLCCSCRCTTSSTGRAWQDLPLWWLQVGGGLDLLDCLGAKCSVVCVLFDISDYA